MLKQNYCSKIGHQQIFVKNNGLLRTTFVFYKNFEKKGDLNVIDINRTTNFRSMGISACFSCFDQANRERLR